MGLSVSSEVGLVSERLVADVTGERFLSGVSSDVSLQQPGPGEGLAAEGTLAALGVGSHVHREGRVGDVDLVAVRTATAGAARLARGAVALAVTGQVAGAAVHAAALGALVAVPGGPHGIGRLIQALPGLHPRVVGLIQASVGLAVRRLGVTLYTAPPLGLRDVTLQTLPERIGEL